MIVRYGLPALAVVLLVFACAYVSQAHKPELKTTPATDPARSPYSTSVSGSGIIEPETENISLGAHVPGIAVEVIAKVGQKIEPGDALFRLDDRPLQAELKMRQAEVEQAQADLVRLENLPRAEQLAINKAEVQEAEANVANEKDQYERTRELAAQKVTSPSDLITHQQLYLGAKAKLAKAQAELQLQKAGAWEFDKNVARAALGRAQAMETRIQSDIEQLTVRAPVAGEVLQVNVRPGEYVGTLASQTMVVVGNVKQLHVRVDIDEYDIPRFHPGAPAQANLKGNPREEFSLKFVRVEPFVIPKRSLTGDNTERVDTRVLQVIYSIDNTSLPLYVGQQVDVFIQDTKEKASGEAPATPRGAGRRGRTIQQ